MLTTVGVEYNKKALLIYKKPIDNDINLKLVITIHGNAICTD